MKWIANRAVSLIAHAPFTLAVIAVALAAASALITIDVAAKPAVAGKPTVVLVHGAFAESSSWDKVTTQLLARGYAVVAVANPLRGLKSDSAYVASAIDAIKGPIVLVGHSYGGGVISNAATDKKNVRALVYVAAFAPDEGETLAALVGKFPGSTLGPALATPVPLSDGGSDLYIAQEKFREQFAADVSKVAASLMAATQRPINSAAIDEAAGKPAWKTIPSWFVYGSLDKNIPSALQQFMAHRAGSKRTTVVDGASHVVMVSHPNSLVMLIEEAAAGTGQP